MKIDIDNLHAVTPDLLKQLDCFGFRPVWLRDDYLSMRGMAFSSERNLYDFLTRVEQVKEQMIKDGYEFYVDKI